MSRYVELQLLTHHSLLRGASSPNELFAAAALLGYPALGVADWNTVGGVVRAWDAQKATGVRLIAGARLELDDGSSLLLYPTDRAAWSRITRLLSIGKGRAGKGGCDLGWSDLAGHAEGQIAILLAGMPDHDLAGQLRALRDAFGRRGHLALSFRRRPDDQARLHALAAIASEAGVRCVATGDILYHAPEVRLLQDVVTAIREKTTVEALGFRRERHADRHLKDPGEMERRFAAFPDAIQATADIAAACRFDLGELSYQYPHERVIEGRTAQEALATLTAEAAERMFPGGVPDAHRAQIAHELKLIDDLGYAPYFLTVTASSRRAGDAVSSARDAARPRTAASASCSASPASIRSNTSCCSSGSSAASGASRRTSTSTSSTSAARRSSSGSTRPMAVIAPP